MPAKIILSPETILQVKKLFDQGLGTRLISKHLRISRWMVQQAYKELGLYNTGLKRSRIARVVTEKNCNICQILKPISEFRRHSKENRITYQACCLPCERAKNFPGFLKWQAKYRIENADKIKQYDREYREKNKNILNKKSVARRKHISLVIKFLVVLLLPRKYLSS